MGRRSCMGLERVTIAAAACALVAGSCGGPSVGQPTTTVDGQVGKVFADQVDIVYMESAPVQVRLEVSGSLPTPCHQAKWEVDDRGDLVEVSLWSEVIPGDVCAQVLEPFEASIPLGSFEAASLPVSLNGEVVGRLEVGMPPKDADASWTGASWSFGMCGGFCMAELRVGGSDLELTGHDWTNEVPLFVNRGSLTAEAERLVDGELSRLEGVTLLSVYGCPDCADGGAASLSLDRNGVVSRHDVPFGQPPAPLAGLYQLAMDVMGDLQVCADTDLVVVDQDCEVVEAR